MRIAIAETGQPDALQPVIATRKRIGARYAAKFKSDNDVVERAAPGHQRLGLEQIAGAID